jgi:hypothetical protein
MLFSFSLHAIAEVHGVLRVVKGDVQIKSAKTGQTTKARLGQEIYPKDSIITGKDARAKIVMVDNNEINVAPESQIEIKNYEYDPAQNKKDVLLNVLYGKVRSKVEQKYDGKTSKFEIKTPSAVAGVRGTDFLTGYDPATKATRVVTFRGAVELGLPGPNGSITNSVSVTPGKTAQTTAGVPPPPPAPVPKEQLSKMDQESRAETPSAPSQDSSKSGKGESPKDKGNKAAPGPSASSTSPAAADPSSPAAPPSPIADTSAGVSAPASDSGRVPASPMAPPPLVESPASAVRPEDLANAPTSNIANIPKPVSLPTLTSPPQLTGATVPPPPCGLTCNQAISKGTGKLVITVRPQ